MSELLLLILSAALVNNLALTHVVGMTPLLATSQRLDTARFMALVTIGLLPLTTGASAVLQTYWLQPAGLDHLTLLIFVFATALIILLAEPVIKRLLPNHAEQCRACLPLLLASNIVLGAALLSRGQALGPLKAVAFGLGSGLGFALVLLIIAGQRERLVAADIPLPFRGHAIAFISLALTAMAFLGLAGLVTI